MSKNYIITLAKPEAQEDHQSLLQELSSKYQKSSSPRDAVELLSGEANDIATNDVISLKSVGAYVVRLSDKDAEELRKKSHIQEVVEDIEVNALGQDAGYYNNAEPDSQQLAAYYQTLANYYGAVQGYGAGNGLSQNLNGQFNPYYGQPQGSGSPQAGNPLLPSPLPNFPFPGLPIPQFPIPPELKLPKFPFPFPPILPLQPVGWNIKLVKADQVWRRVNGNGVRVAIIDTGIDTSHPDLTVSGGVSMVPGVVSYNDDNSHGTHCAGIVAARNNLLGVVGVAPKAKLYAVKVLNSAGSGQLSWILAGMEWAAQNKMDVASMSLGSNVSTTTLDYIVAYQRAAENLNSAGCIVIAAAGNNGRSATNPWVGNPARCPSIVAVAAVDKNCKIADFSSHGPAALPHDRGVEISAPGVEINSTIPGGYGLKSGTSMACPHVAGAAALIKQLRPTWTPQQIRARLRSTATDLGAPHYDEYYGFGLLDCYRAIYGSGIPVLEQQQASQSGYSNNEFYRREQKELSDVEYASHYGSRQSKGVPSGAGSLV